jgi:DNA-binding NarL/FixJ family response regulator
VTTVEAKTRDEGPGGLTRTAVVADDFPAARSLFADALRISGTFNVVAEAADGFEVLDAVARHRPDLAVLDLAMPRAGGLDVIEDINALSAETRVVVVSGFPGRDLENLVLAAGAAGYVRKRPSIREVIDEITVAAGLLELAQEVLAATQRFPEDLSSPRQARRFLDEVLERWQCQPAIDTLQVLISEVVTNAVLHAHSQPEVSVLMLGSSIRVEVSDDSEQMPVISERDELAVRGRGMGMLAAEASGWGVSLRPGGGKTVWFDVPVFTGASPS